MSCLILLACLIALSQAQVDPSQPFTFTAYASNFSIVASSSSTATGQGVFQYNSATGTLYASVVHSVINATAMHLHGTAYPGASSAPIFFFANGSSPAYISWPATAQQATDMINGKYYWNIHSVLYPNGEIRGQVLSQGYSEIFLSPAYVVPPVSDVEGFGWGLSFFNSSTNVVEAIINTNSTSTTSAFLAGPANYTSTGSSLLSLNNSGSGLFENTGTIQGNYYLSESIYAELASATDAQGFARGQIEPPVNYAAALVSSATSAVFGVAEMVAYTQLGYVRIVHNLATATSLSVGGQSVPLPSFASPIQFEVPASLLGALLQGLPNGLVTVSITDGTTTISGNARVVGAPLTSATSTTSSTASTSSTSTATSSSTATTLSTASSTSTVSTASTSSTSTKSTTSNGMTFKRGAFECLLFVSLMSILA